MTTSRKDALAELWRRGSLSWQLRDYQRDIVRQYETSGSRKFFSLCSRRTGKTRTALTRAHEKARKGGVYRFCYPTLLQAEDVLVPMTDEIHETCPEQYRPKYLAKHLAWEYPDGLVKLAGAETRRAANRMRGSTTTEFILDETCFYDEFEYILKDIVMPTLLTSDGSAWLLSTPPDTPGHPSRDVYEECLAAGASATVTIDVLRRFYPPERIDEFIREAGGIESTTYKREYLCQWITDASRAVVPEFSRARHVGDVHRPSHIIPVVVGDFGFTDMSVVGFGYYHMPLGKIVIEDEVVAQRESALAVGRRVHSKENELMYRDPARYADAPPQVLADMYEGSGVMFGPAVKTDADAALNTLRRYCQTDKILISPKCKVTIAHLEMGIWNASRTSFERVNGMGHFDGIDMAKYFVRHVDQHTNPFPSLSADVNPVSHFIRPGVTHDRPHDTFKQFGWR